MSSQNGVVVCFFWFLRMLQGEGGPRRPWQRKLNLLKLECMHSLEERHMNLKRRSFGLRRSRLAQRRGLFCLYQEAIGVSQAGSGSTEPGLWVLNFRLIRNLEKQMTTVLFFFES